MSLRSAFRDPARSTRWRGDFLGGTVAALIAVPYAMALSIAMGLRPEAGLYTSIIGGAISGMLSDAPTMVSGLSATIVPVLALLVKTHGVGAALAAGVLSGLVMVSIGALRLGRFFNYLPGSVIGAFTSGLGMIIVVSQLKEIFGFKPGPAGFNLGVVDDVYVIARDVRLANGHSLAVAGAVMGLMFVLPRVAPAFDRLVPASLLAVILASIAVHALGWQMPTVGALPAQFPRPGLGYVDFSAFSSLLSPAFTLAGLITINQLLTVVVTDRLKEERGELRFNRELIAQGAANIVCPFFGAPPGVAMLARTVASARAGAVSRWSVVAHSLVLALFLLPLRNLISQIPLVVLAAVTVAVGLQLVGIERFRQLRRMGRLDAALFLFTFSLILISDLIVGVGLGMFVAMLLFVERTAQSTQLEPVSPVPAKQETSAIFPFDGEPGLQSEMQIFRLTGPLFFGSSERILTQLSREAKTKTLVLDLTDAGSVDSAAIDCLRRIAVRQRNRGGELHLLGLDPQSYRALERDGLLAGLGSAIRREEPSEFAELDRMNSLEPDALAGANASPASLTLNLSSPGGTRI